MIKLSKLGGPSHETRSKGGDGIHLSVIGSREEIIIIIIIMGIYISRLASEQL